MSYTKTGKPRGRPRTHTLETGPVKFSLRCPRPLYQSLEAAAKAQSATITATALWALEQALGVPQHHGASVDLAAVETGLLAIGEAVAALEARCNCCEQCRTHVTVTIDDAWPKLVAVTDCNGNSSGLQSAKIWDQIICFYPSLQDRIICH